MAKFYGEIGYAETSEVEPGIWAEQITYRPYYGEITRNLHNFKNGEGVNDNITMSSNLSIIADPYANKNFQYMRCIRFKGSKWKINNVEINYPRIILSIGGVYNGE